MTTHEEIVESTGDAAFATDSGGRILAWNEAKPRTHHGPALANEWPDSTLDDHLTLAVDKRRQIYEGTLREGNATPSQKHKVLGRSSAKHQVLPKPDVSGPLPPLRKGI